ncbi:MAG: tetratricopeptide repeat protein, partial [Anaerolineae bacterium]
AGDAWETAVSLARLGSAAWNLGKYGRAAEYHEQALTIRQKLKDWRGVARSNMSLGMTWLCQGRFAQAEALVREGSALRQKMGDRRGIADGLRFLGITQINLGEFAAAAKNLHDSVLIYDELGLHFGLERAMLGTALAHQGKYDEASRWIAQGVALAEETGYRRALGYALLAEGEVALVNGRLAEAEASLRRSLGYYEQIHQEEEMGRVLTMLAALFIQQDDSNRAARMMAAAHRQVGSCQAVQPAIYLLPVLGMWFAYQGNDAQALDMLSLAAGFDLAGKSAWFGALLAGVTAVWQEAKTRVEQNGRPHGEIWQRLADTPLAIETG